MKTRTELALTMIELNLRKIYLEKAARMMTAEEVLRFMENELKSLRSALDGSYFSSSGKGTKKP